jgi:membrane protease YdiL (CAAX protease family)
MYIANALTIKNNFWRYVLGVFIIFIFTQIGSIPFIVAIFNKVGLEGAANLDASKMMTILENSNLTFFYTLLTFFVGFIGFIIVIKYLHNQSILSITSSRKSIDYKRILTSFTAISTILVLNILFSFLISPEDYILQFNLNDFLILLLIAVIFIPVQTSLEEYVFRGYLMQGLGVMINNKWLPLILTSFSFGFLHFYNPEIMKLGSILLVHYVATGLFLGILTLMDEGMELALGFHAGNNLLIALIVTADWTVFQTTSILKYIGEPNVINQSLFSLSIIYPILLFYFSRKYNWTNWKDKLTGKVK